MKTLIFNSLIVLLTLPAMPVFSQPVPQIDAVVLLEALAAPPATLREAYARAYAKTNPTRPDASAFYKSWQDQLDRAGLDLQKTILQSYGRQAAASPAPAKMSPQHQAAMDAATAELVRKMTGDPAFAQQFAKMSEAEQQAYIAKLLADKGLKPAQGTPNKQAVVPGTDIDWMSMSNQIMQEALNMQRWDTQLALQQKYEREHRTIDSLADTQVKKLPLIEMGEYGHDHDPEQVKAIRLKAMAQHALLAETMLKACGALFAQYRLDIKQRISPFNQALQEVGYGKVYDFGIHYRLVLETQTMTLQELNVLCKYAMDVTRDAARWEFDYREAMR